MSSNKNSGGYGLPIIIFVVFLVLKLTNNIDWSWIWVTSPLWIPFAFILGISLLILSVIIISLLLGVKVDDLKSRIESFKK